LCRTYLLVIGCLRNLDCSGFPGGNGTLQLSQCFMSSCILKSNLFAELTLASSLPERPGKPQMSLGLVPRRGGGPPSWRRAEEKVPQGNPNQTPRHIGCRMSSFNSLSTLACSRFRLPPFWVRSNSKTVIPVSLVDWAERPEPLNTSRENGPITN